MRRCAYCKRSVDIGEAIIDDLLWYHDDCYYLKILKQVQKYQEKFDTGTITLREANKWKELQTILENCKKTLTKPTIRMSDILESTKPVFSGNSNGIKALENYKYEVEQHNDKNKQIKRVEGPKSN